MQADSTIDIDSACDCDCDCDDKRAGEVDEAEMEGAKRFRQRRWVSPAGLLKKEKQG